MTRSAKQAGDAATKVLKDLLIVQLGVARVPQQTIQKIVGCDIRRVNEIVKHLKRRT